MEFRQGLLQFHAVGVPVVEQKEVIPETNRVVVQFLQQHQGVFQDLEGFGDLL